MSTTPTRARESGRLAFLDGIRGVAALAVVLEHALAQWLPEFSRLSLGTLSMGRVGVVAFFLVSGYVIGLTLSKQTVPVFVVRRFWRLFPVYWIVLAAAILVHPDQVQWTERGTITLVLNILMVQGILALPSIIGSAWTLGPELLYYAQAALSRRLGKLELSVYLGYFWLALYAALAVLSGVLHRELPATTPLMLFLASFGYSIFLRDRQRSRVWVGYLVAAIIVVPLASLPLLSAQQDPASAYGFAGFNLSLMVGLALFGTFFSFRGRPAWTPLLWLGSISYALYLVHLPLIESVARLGVNGWWGVPTSVIVAVVLGWLVHRWLEIPFIRLGRQRSRGYQSAAATSAQS